MRTVLDAATRGALIGFFGGFLLFWLWPLYAGAVPHTAAGIYHAAVSVSWTEVLLSAAVMAFFWAEYSFRHETELGGILSLLWFVGSLMWRLAARLLSVW